MVGNIYFIGIGGIGMSALARYFLHEGMGVAGYDLVATPLTSALEAEGAAVHYDDDPGLIPDAFRDPATTLVVYTPAVPANHRELAWFRAGGFTVEKRSEMLGHVSEGKFVMAVAGTHGKTTTTTLVAWLNSQVAGNTGGRGGGNRRGGGENRGGRSSGNSGNGCGGGCKSGSGDENGNSASGNNTGGGSAFLGGISKNFDSNLVLESFNSVDSLASERRLGKARECFETERTDAYVMAQNSNRNAASPPLSGQRHAVEADELSPCADPRRPAADLRAPVDEFAPQNRPRLAVEADEFDRSFLRLNPDVTVITSVDADHLDIYGTYEAVKEAFAQFTDRVKPGGSVIVSSRADIEVRNRAATHYSYSLDDPATDFHATDLRALPGGYYNYDISTPDGVIADCRLGITGRINVENSIAAVALMWAAAKMRGEKLDHEKLRAALSSFQGVRRRFDFWVNTPYAAYMDDYAHHPEELAAALGSLREMFPGRRITAIFQPHLYTRTRDLHREFAAALSKADELILTPIYPARELPIEGVDAETIGRHVTEIPWRVIPKEQLAAEIARTPTDVVVTFGAGNIENHCAGIAEVVEAKARSEEDKNAKNKIPKRH